jgi:hypothetical protein
LLSLLGCCCLVLTVQQPVYQPVSRFAEHLVLS